MCTLQIAAFGHMPLKKHSCRNMSDNARTHDISMKRLRLPLCERPLCVSGSLVSRECEYVLSWVARA
jgi:hypothetical protein